MINVFYSQEKKNTVYHLIQELIQEGKCAWFVNREGRFRIKWKIAVERYIEYRAKKNPKYDLRIDRRKASNSFREALLHRYGADGAKEYEECQKVGENKKIVEREFQMPSKVFHSLFGSSEELLSDQVIWSGLPVNYHVLSIFQTLFWSLTPWYNIHNVNPPYILIIAFLLFWNFLVKILQSFWISICLPINIPDSSNQRSVQALLLSSIFFCLNSPEIIFFVVYRVQFIFTWEFLGALHLKLLTGFVNTYHINRCCGWQLYKVSMGNNGVVVFRPLSSGHIN